MKDITFETSPRSGYRLLNMFKQLGGAVCELREH